MSKNLRDPYNWQPATQRVRGGLARSLNSETSEALYLTSGYTYESAEQAAARMAGEEPGFVYTRYGNPTVRMLEERLALLEGAPTARVTGSGMSAIASVLLASCEAGDRVVAAKALFGACRWIVGTLLPRYNIETELVDGRDLEAWKKALSNPANIVLVESPSNPLLEAVDIEAVSKLCREAGAKLVVDNVFATPILQKPMQLGADISVYSATKHMDGQGRVLAGAIIGQTDWIEDNIDQFLKQTGPSVSPFNAWVILKGLETLELRLHQMVKNAKEVAKGLMEHPAVAKVYYPGHPSHPQFDIHSKQMSSGGSLIAISVKGKRTEAFRVLNSLQIIDISNNLGDAKSLACHPASTTHRTLTDEERDDISLDDSWIRVSIGLEDPIDLLADLNNALDKL